MANIKSEQENTTSDFVMVCMGAAASRTFGKETLTENSNNALCCSFRKIKCGAQMQTGVECCRRLRWPERGA